ncbi:MAG: Ig-like domain-containing protein [Clostridia bacterium]|nr:Ig-like domain-containing protein [Clostridia bacterium]
MKKLDAKKLLYPGVITLLSLFFIVGVIFGWSLVIHMDGAYPPYEAAEAYAPAPRTPAEAAQMLNDAVALAAEAAPKTKTESRASIADGGVALSAADGAEPLPERYAEIFRSDGAEHRLEDLYNASYARHGEETAFGDPLDRLLGSVRLAAGDVADFTCSDTYYVCENCGRTDDAPFGECPGCGLAGVCAERKRDCYILTLYLAAREELPAYFPLRGDADTEALFRENGRGIFTVRSLAADRTSPRIRAEIGRTDGRLERLDFLTDITLESTLDFTPAYPGYGAAAVRAVLEDDVRYTFTWPSIVISDGEPLLPGKTFVVEPGKSDAIRYAREPEEGGLEVIWKSSDPELLTVDGEGYVKAGKRTGEATVTASFEFGGRIWSDSVRVSVRVPAKRLGLNKYRLTLAAGDSGALKATVYAHEYLPQKASVQTVTWYSADESVATVDRDGTVRAVSPGETVIYALSDDGFFKASCKTEVTA